MCPGAGRVVRGFPVAEQCQLLSKLRGPGYIPVLRSQPESSRPREHRASLQTAPHDRRSPRHTPGNCFRTCAGIWLGSPMSSRPRPRRESTRKVGDRQQHQRLRCHRGHMADRRTAALILPSIGVVKNAQEGVLRPASEAVLGSGIVERCPVIPGGRATQATAPRLGFARASGPPPPRRRNVRIHPGRGCPFTW
jgi:hypothetical protein